MGCVCPVYRIYPTSISFSQPNPFSRAKSPHTRMASPMSTSSSTSSREKSTLLTIPHELLFHILTGVEPEDLHSLRGTSRGLRDFIGGGGGSGGVWRGVLGGIVVSFSSSSV